MLMHGCGKPHHLCPIPTAIISLVPLNFPQNWNTSQIGPRQEQWDPGSVYVHMNAGLYPRGLNQRLGILPARRKPRFWFVRLSYQTVAYRAFICVMFTCLPKPQWGIDYIPVSLTVRMTKTSSASILWRNEGVGLSSWFQVSCSIWSESLWTRKCATIYETKAFLSLVLW